MWAPANFATIFCFNPAGRALADYSEAIQLDPKLIFAYFNSGVAYNRKGEYDHAVADFDEVIRLRSDFVPAYLERGRANLYAGLLPKALIDFNQAGELNPKYVYAALWLDVVNKRSNLPSRLSEATKRIDMTK
jgi:tetratricopeptide (TPR) repeat protein